MSRLQVIKGGVALGMGLADYIWLDKEGHLRHKKKTILIGKNERGDPVPLAQRWSFAQQDCDCDADAGCKCPQTTYILSPCFFLPDPTRPQPNYLILCEVRDTEDRCVPWCHRAPLRKAMHLRGASSKLVWYGFRQGYQLLDADEQPAPNLAERRFLTGERHLGACFDAGLLIHSIWNEPGIALSEFKVGVRGFPQDLDPDPPSALVVADHLVVALYLLQKIGGEKGLALLHGDMSLFISTPELREPGSDARLQATLLMTALAGEDRRLRPVPHPVNGGCQCIEVMLGPYRDPYQVALEALEAVWPLGDDQPEPVTSEEEP